MVVMLRLLAVLALATTLPAWAETLDESVRRLVARVAKAAPAASLQITYSNRSTYPEGSFDELRGMLERQFHPFTQREGPPMKLLVAVTENAAGKMLVARSETGELMIIEPLPAPGASPTQYRFSLQVRPIWTQPRPILDFALVADALVVLEPRQLVWYRRELGPLKQDAWKQDRTVDIPSIVPTPRDPRGRLIPSVGGFEVYLPGQTCFVSTTVQCRPEITQWREGALNVSWAAGRNFLMSPGLENIPVYTTASFTGIGSVSAKINGRLLLKREGATATETREKFGSDLARLPAACVEAPVMIVTSPSSEPDSVQAFEWKSNELTPVTEPVPVVGAVSGLWPSESMDAVSLIVRNSKTGEYEASRLSIPCAR